MKSSLMMVLSLLGAAVLGGCSAGQPASRAHWQAPAGAGRIIVYREQANSGGTLRVDVENQRGGLLSREYTYFDVTPGTHRVSTPSSFALAMSGASVKVRVGRGERKFVRITSRQTGPGGVIMAGNLPIIDAGTFASEMQEVPPAVAEPTLARFEYAPAKAGRR